MVKLNKALVADLGSARRCQANGAADEKNPKQFQKKSHSLGRIRSRTDIHGHIIHTRIENDDNIENNHYNYYYYYIYKLVLNYYYYIFS